MEEKVDYNEEPVYYCKQCLSLRILSIDNDTCYCDDCGTTDIGSSSIYDWESQYINKFGHKYINSKYYGEGRKEKTFV